MIAHITANRILWFITGSLSLLASVIGVFRQDVYQKVITAKWLPGTISQDLITMIAALSLLALALFMKERHVKLQILVLSLLLYMFYAYGIYVIEQLYNSLYLLYIAIFALSFWVLVYSLISLRKNLLSNIFVPNIIRYISIGFALFIPVLFYSIWTSQLLPLMKTGNKIEFTYSIYILDMGFVLPALIISAVLAIKKSALGLVLLPVLFIKAFTLLFSVGLGGLLKPFYNQNANAGETMFYIGLSVIFLVLAIIYLAKLDIQRIS